MSDTKKKKFVLVKSTSPRPSFRRAGFTFTPEWRPLELGEKDDVANDIVGPESYARIEAEKMLACKPATETEVEQFLKDRAELAGKDPQAVNEELKRKNAELEARLLKLELAQSAKNEKKS